MRECDIYYRADIYKDGESWVSKTVKSNSLDTLKGKISPYISDDKYGLIEVYHVSETLYEFAKFPSYFDDELINAIKEE